MAEKISTNKARQGRWGAHVLLVLVVGLALAGVVWLGLEFYGEAIDADSTGQPGGVQTETQQPDATPNSTPE